MRSLLLKIILLIGCLLFTPAVSTAALSGQTAAGITFFVVNLTQNDFSVLINCEYFIATDMFIKPRMDAVRFYSKSDSTTDEDQGGDGTFSYDTIEPDFIEKSATSDTVAATVKKNVEDDSVFGNKITIGAFDERQLLISSISRVKFQLGEFMEEMFTPIKTAYSLSSGTGTMSTNANPDNSGIKIAMYDNGLGQSSWTLISQEAASSWNYTGASGQRYEYSYIVNFPVIYVLYDSNANFANLINEFKKYYAPTLIGNVYYPKKILLELTSGRNNWDDLFTAGANVAGSYREKLFPNSVEMFKQKKLFFGSGEEIETPNFNTNNP